MQLTSSNPAFSFEETHFGTGAAARPDEATLSGVVNRTGILVGVACVAGAGGYAIMPAAPWLPMPLAIGAFVIMLISGFILRKNPRLAASVGFVYAIVEGLFLGALTALLDGVLYSFLATKMAAAGNPIVATGLALPAFIITISVTIAMLLLYKAKILRPTRRFQAVVGTLTMGVMFTYLIMFVLSFAGIQMPFLSLGSAFGGGMAPLIGLGLSLFLLGLASLWLIIDFGRIEEMVDAGMPRYMEWYGGFILLTTLAWIYFEALKLVFRLAIMFSSRD